MKGEAYASQKLGVFGNGDHKPREEDEGTWKN